MAQSTLGETLDADGWKALFMANGIKEDSVNRVTCLAPDWSKEGMGFFLLQKY